MTNLRLWSEYRAHYRTEEVQTVASWIQAADSGVVVGLGGAGKSNFLGFLCYRPEVIKTHLSPDIGPLAIVSVDLNSLPTTDLATLHRLILRAFFEIRDYFEPILTATITELYQAHRGERDLFLTQCALRDLLFAFQKQNGRVVLVLDRFDDSPEKR
jgi:hypothetical protein